MSEARIIYLSMHKQVIFLVHELECVCLLSRFDRKLLKNVTCFRNKTNYESLIIKVAPDTNYKSNKIETDLLIIVNYHA